MHACCQSNSRAIFISNPGLQDRDASAIDGKCVVHGSSKHNAICFILVAVTNDTSHIKMMPEASKPVAGG